MMMIGNADPTMVSMLLGAMATLGTVIAVLYRHIQMNFVRMQEKLDDCETDRANLWHVIAKQAGCRVEDLKQD